MEKLLSNHPALKDTLNEMVETAGYLWDRGWAEANGGNISIDISDDIHSEFDDLGKQDEVRLPVSYDNLRSRYFIVSGSGRRFRDLPKTPAENCCILKISEKGNGYRIVWGGRCNAFRPTSEFPSHLKLHDCLRSNSSKHKVVLHTHPNDIIAMTHIDEYCNSAAMSKALWGMLPEVKVLIPRGLGFVEYRLPGSEELAAGTFEQVMSGFEVVIWEMHGCLAVADSPLAAFDLLDTANKAASILLSCRAAGFRPKGMSEAQLAELDAAFGPTK